MALSERVAKVIVSYPKTCIAFSIVGSTLLSIVGTLLNFRMNTDYSEMMTADDMASRMEAARMKLVYNSGIV